MSRKRGSEIGSVRPDKAVVRKDQLYAKVQGIESSIRRKYQAQDVDVVSGMDNVAASSVESLKSDMSVALNRSAMHSAHQVATEDYLASIDYHAQMTVQAAGARMAADTAKTHMSNGDMYSSIPQSARKSMARLNNARIGMLPMTDKKALGQLGVDCLVEELATQIRRWQLKAEELEKLLEHKDDSMREKQATQDECEEDEDHDNDKSSAAKATGAINPLAADKHLALNNYGPDPKYDAQTGHYEKKLRDRNEALQIKSILEYKSIDDVPKLDDDEVPDFQLYADPEQLDEEQMGRFNKELMRVFRANTQLNLQLPLAEWEREALVRQLDEMHQPLVIQLEQRRDGKVKTAAVALALQLKMQNYIEVAHKGKQRQMRLIDKYRLIKKRFCVTKRKAAAVMAEPEELRKSVADEVKQFQTKRHEFEEELEREKEILVKQLSEKMDEVNEDIERERVEHKKDAKLFKNEVKHQQNCLAEMHANAVREEKFKATHRGVPWYVY